MKRAGLVILGVTGLLLALIPLAFVLDTAVREPPEVIPGYTEPVFEVEHRDVPLTARVWYPTVARGEPELLGQNALFYGHHVQRDVPQATGARGLIVVSHGSGGRTHQFGWLAETLAQSWIVAGVDHPGTMSRDSVPARTPMIWERTQDLSALLDHLQSGGAGVSVDEGPIVSMGFSLGGAAALSFAGAELSKQAFIAYCDRVTGELDCGWLQAAEVDFQEIDAALYEANYRDPRVDAVIALDPALVQAMTPDSLERVDMPALVLNLGEPDTLPLGLDAAEVAATLPNATYRALSGGTHFHALPECSWLGAFIIGLAGDDNICTGTIGDARSPIHNGIEAEIGAFLQSL